jgi:hypothetical protein
MSVCMCEIGACDNLAVNALFRRKVKNIILCDAVYYDVINEVDPNSDTLRKYFLDFYGLFGLADESGESREFNKVMTQMMHTYIQGN